jgi:hypothetical protein
VLWEQRLLALFDDLELQAEGLALAERDGEVGELARAEYARLALADRLHGNVGARLTIGLGPSVTVEGVARQVGSDWLLLEEAGHEWVIRLAAVGLVRGLTERALAPAARPVTAGLGVGSVLRRLAEAGEEVIVQSLCGDRRCGVLGRVGADFVELGGPAGRPADVLPFGSFAGIRRG